MEIHAGFSSGVILAFKGFGFTKQHRDTPDSGKAHQRVDHAADCSGLTPKKECHGIKAEQSDAAPVERADNGERQGKFVDDHENILLLLLLGRVIVCECFHFFMRPKKYFENFSKSIETLEPILYNQKTDYAITLTGGERNEQKI